jgi:hypothetical protein
VGFHDSVGDQERHASSAPPSIEDGPAIGENVITPGRDAWITKRDHRAR